ncbi:MAG: hypothetical protein R2826_03545 [Thermoleophilia bacterium]
MTPETGSSCRIGLVGCVKKKLGHAAPAAELYVSPLFRGRRAHVERTCERWFILSALHGLLRPETEIDPYDVTLNDMSRAERRAWADKVLSQIEAALGSCADRTFEIHAGANYANFGLVDGLRERGATVEQPTAGLSLGEQLAFYAKADHAAAACAEAPAAFADMAATAATAPPGTVPKCDDEDVLKAIAALDEAPTVVTAREWPNGVASLDQPGLYAWFVDADGAHDLAEGLGHDISAGRIYVGQAGATRWPSGKPSDNTLGTRIDQMHLHGKVRMSTFRWTLASMLFAQLDVQVQDSMAITESSELALTEWMREHLSLAIYPHDHRDTLENLERQVLAWLDPPLNLRHMAVTPARERLTQLRRRIAREEVGSEQPRRVDATPTRSITTEGGPRIFPLTLQKTYSNTGFFNVTRKYDGYVRATEGPVRLRLGREGEEIDAQINRSANSNHTARIMGGVALKKWFQGNFKALDTVLVDLTSQDVIVLSEK